MYRDISKNNFIVKLSVISDVMKLLLVVFEFHCKIEYI